MLWDDVFNSLYEEIMKERTKKDMKLEYKFYEKNLAPKWLEGDYDLHIEGNRMTMTSKDGKKVEARCHPDDDWRLQVGIDELKERMAEAKKPREIEVGDKVRVLSPTCYQADSVVDFFAACHIPMQDVIEVAYADALNHIPNSHNPCIVKYIGHGTSSKTNKQDKFALIESVTTGNKYVVGYANLELVS